MNSLQGHLLVASPKLRDPNFFRTVVLLVEHNDEGAMGLVLNRPSKVSIEEAWSQVRDTPCKIDGLLFHGGPCPGPLMAIHSQEKLLETEVLPNVFFSTGQELLDQLVENGGEAARFFVGCAGWGSGQLEKELEEDAWRTAPATPVQIFQKDAHANLWESVYKELSRSSLLSMLDIKHPPIDPSMN